ncbi:MAG: hypothetical protein OEY99_06525 [Aigarchaeota archaeon]|nr:hypothetical protein [Aigarchaeota archaeon]
MWLKELTCSICGRQMDIPGGEVHGKHICKTCFQLFRHDEKNGDGKNVTIDWLRQDMTTEEMIGQIERELKEAAALQAMSGLNNIEKVMELSDKQRPAALASAALLKLVRALVVQNQLLLSNGIKRERLASRTQRLAEYLGSQHGQSRQ